ncbi:putative mannosyltransferase ktr4 [Umbelopsis sp. WA50703]
MPHLLAWFLVYGFLLVIYIYYIDGNPRPTVVGPQWGTENEPQPLADGESIDKTIPIRIHPNLETTEPWLNETNRANAAIVIVAPSKEYINVQKTIVHLEAQFNNRFQYPYVFLSELSQDSAYKQNIRRLIGKRAHFGSLEMGQRDDNIASLVASHFLNSTDSEKEYLTEQTQLSRFKTGMLFRHRLVENLDYIWYYLLSISTTDYHRK